MASSQRSSTLSAETFSVELPFTEANLMNEPGETRWQFEDTARVSRTESASTVISCCVVLEFSASFTIRVIMMDASSNMNSGALRVTFPDFPFVSISAATV